MILLKNIYMYYDRYYIRKGSNDKLNIITDINNLFEIVVKSIYLLL